MGVTGPAFRREVQFIPGHNHLHERGPRARGQNGMEIRFVLHGPEGAVYFSLGTGWTPLGQIDENRETGEDLVHTALGRSPEPYSRGVGYHWRTPVWRDHEPRDDCHALGGATCYNNHGYSWGDDIGREFMRRGEPAVWLGLIRQYREIRTESDENFRGLDVL